MLGKTKVKKIAIITLYDDTNFGNKLQNYATQQYFENMGFEVETIPYVEEKHPHRSLKYRIHSLIMSFLVLFGLRKKTRKNTQLDEKRRNHIKTFSEEYINLASEISYRKLPKDFANEYDFFVTGSDQVWRSWNDDEKEIRFFLLMFAPSDKRITMSPSFGLDHVNKKFESLYKMGLDGFNHISVRELEGKELVKNLCGKDSTVLLDPTMLVDEGVWNRMLKRPKLFCKKDYILVYLLGDSSSRETEIKDISQKIGAEIIDINDDLFYTTTRPDEFLYWIYNAKLIITDSFHATVFSILFKKNFVVLLNNNPGMSNRMTTLLSTFNLNERGYYNGTKFNLDDLFDVNFDETINVLKQERDKAKFFFDSCLNK